MNAALYDISRIKIEQAGASDNYLDEAKPFSQELSHDWPVTRFRATSIGDSAGGTS